VAEPEAGTIGAGAVGGASPTLSEGVGVNGAEVGDSTGRVGVETTDGAAVAVAVAAGLAVDTAVAVGAEVGATAVGTTFVEEVGTDVGGTVVDTTITVPAIRVGCSEQP